MTSRTLVASIALGAAFLVQSLTSPAAHAAPAPMYAAYIVDPTGKDLGRATFIQVDSGVQVLVDVKGLPPGMHGMHIHEYGSCNQLRDTTGAVTVFGAAGGHFDPGATGHHLGPDGAGHAGDLPMINVDLAGHGRTTFYTTKFSVVQGPLNIVGRSIVIHANPDNFTDTPPNGGSGARIACGEIGPMRAQ